MVRGGARARVFFGAAYNQPYVRTYVREKKMTNITTGSHPTTASVVGSLFSRTRSSAVSLPPSGAIADFFPPASDTCPFTRAVT